MKSILLFTFFCCTLNLFSQKNSTDYFLGDRTYCKNLTMKDLKRFIHWELNVYNKIVI